MRVSKCELAEMGAPPTIDAGKSCRGAGTLPAMISKKFLGGFYELSPEDVTPGN